MDTDFINGLPTPEVTTPPVYQTALSTQRGKNIVVCSDGTGNADVKGRGSNVFKFFEAIDTSGHLHDIELPRQIAFYDEGVGTSTWKPLKLLGGALGIGIGQNVRELYKEIARAYSPGKGDRLYLFGFSRGAFTVRMLAGLIEECGIPDGQVTSEQLDAAVKSAYRHYLRKREMPLTLVPFDRGRSPIEFLGVWDTVDAVGLPFRISDLINRFFPFKRDVSAIPSSVRFGCQALALDDQRTSFRPVLWRRADNVEQVWFAGAHSNVGGGYARQGVSLIPLHWMMERAAARGLRFIRMDQRYYDEHQMLSDKVHDSRAGLGRYYRWLPRDVTALCREAAVDPHVHISVFDRVAQVVDGYAPINVPLDPVIAFTEYRDRQFLNPTAVHYVLRQHRADVESSARKAARPIWLGIKSYWMFVLGSVLVALALGRLFPETTTIGALLGTVLAPLAAVLDAAGRVFDVLAPSLDAPRIARVSLAAGATLLVLAYALAAWTDRWLDGIYSRSWHAMRRDLLSALTRRPARPVAQPSAMREPAATVVELAGSPGRISSPPERVMPA